MLKNCERRRIKPFGVFMHRRTSGHASYVQFANDTDSSQEPSHSIAWTLRISNVRLLDLNAGCNYTRSTAFLRKF